MAEENALLSNLSDSLLWQILVAVVVVVIVVALRVCRSSGGDGGGGGGVLQFCVKIAVYYVSVSLAGVLTIVLALPKPWHWRNHILMQVTCQYLLRPVLGLDIVPRGMEHLFSHGPAILVVNHQSSIDLIMLFNHWPPGTVGLGKKELLYYGGPFGLGAWLCGSLFIDRSNQAKARKTLDQAVTRIQQEQLKVMMFPEGTRNHQGSLLPFKKGAFHLAVQAQVPVIPLVISSYKHFYSKKPLRFNAGKVVMEALPPIPTEGLTADDVTSLMEATREKMLTCYNRISLEAANTAVPRATASTCTNSSDSGSSPTTNATITPAS